MFGTAPDGFATLFYKILVQIGNLMRLPARPLLFVTSALFAMTLSNVPREQVTSSKVRFIVFTVLFITRSLKKGRTVSVAVW